MRIEESVYTILNTSFLSLLETIPTKLIANTFLKTPTVNSSD